MKEIHFSSVSSPDLVRLDLSSLKGLLSLEVGQILRGKVLGVIDDRHAVLQLKGHDIPVESQVPLQSGMEGTFKVISLHPQIILKFLPEEGMVGLEIGKGLKALLMADAFGEDFSERLSHLWTLAREKMPPPLRETMDRLMGLWTFPSLSGSSLIDPGPMERMVLQSGLFFEHLLKRIIKDGHLDRLEEGLNSDAKGLLLRLKSQLIAEKTHSQPQRLWPDQLEQLLKGIDHLLKRIESYQQLSVSSTSGMEEKAFLFLPIWVNERLQFVDLCLSLPRFRPEEVQGRGISMLFLLHLPEWGRMSIEVRLIGKRLYGQFFFSGEEVALFFNHVLLELQESLTRLGFQPEIRVATRSSEKILEHFVSEMKGEERFLLDLLV